MRTQLQGEQVRAFLRCPGQDAGSGCGFQIPIYDINGNLRPVQAWERVVVDSINVGIYGPLNFPVTVFGASGTVGLTGASYPLYGPSSLARIEPPNAQILFTANFLTTADENVTQSITFSGEGVALPLAANLYLWEADGALGQTDFYVDVIARVVNGTTRGPRAGYKARLTPGGSTVF
jgi:hypothetical protein